MNYSPRYAITSTSHNTFFGNVFTATQLLAGFDVKYFPYTSLNAAKSLISARKHVVFNTLSNDVPASFKTSPKFLHTCVLFRKCGFGDDCRAFVTMV